MATSRHIPLNALRAVECVARWQALGPAARELGVTPGAVSQQIRRAETRVGGSLFVRSATGLVPTAELKAVLGQLRTGFQALADASDALQQAENTVLTISVGNVFASRWLVHRLNRFHALAPQIDLRIMTSGILVDLARPDIDCGVRFGTGEWVGVRSELLGGRTSFPVCTPELARTLNVPADLATVPVIEDPSGMLAWDDWFKGAGLPVPATLSGPGFSDPAIAFDAALAGQGVLLSIDMMVCDALAAGRLVKPFSHEQASKFGYWFVTHNSKGTSGKIRVFLDWIRSEIQLTAV